MHLRNRLRIAVLVGLALVSSCAGGASSSPGTDGGPATAGTAGPTGAAGASTTGTTGAAGTTGATGAAGTGGRSLVGFNLPEPAATWARGFGKND